VGCLSAVGLVAACTVLAPSFAPTVDTDQMRRERLESRFIELGGRQIHYVSTGRDDLGAPRILFIHGSPGTWEAWRVWLEDGDLRQRARLLALDRPGFGGSGRGSAEPSLSGQAAAAAAVLRAEGTRPALVVGHSLGGPIAIRLALDAPELVADLVLLAPSIDPDLERRRWFNVAGSWRLVQLFLPIDWVVSNRELWPLRSELETLRRDLPRLRAPALLLQGLDDRLVPAANADFAEAMLPPNRLEVRRYPGAGHFLLWQRPGLVRDALLERLDAEVDAPEARR